MIKVQDSNPDREFQRDSFYYIMTKRIRMLLQVKRMQNLFLTLTLMVLITGSILAFSIQAAYSAADYNSSRSNTSTAVAKVLDELNKLKSDARISGDANMISSIDNMVDMFFDIEQGLVEMDKFFSATNAELQSLKQTAESIPQTTESTEKTFSFGGTLESTQSTFDIMTSGPSTSTGETQHSMGIRSMGSYLTETNSGKICGLSLCSGSMTIEEKIQLYLDAIKPTN